MNTAEAVALVAARLAAAGIENSRREARIILAAALNTDLAGLLLHTTLDPAIFEQFVARREAREPMAYILGKKEFWGMSFTVSPATLIPRPETETLIEAALMAYPERNAVTRILDLGTGTGCLLLAALHEFPAAFGLGVDISPAAAHLAARNAAALGLASRAAFIAGNWATSLAGTFNLILANPPYIPAGDLPGLMPDVRNHEPRAALDGGADGLAAYRQICAVLPRLLASDGIATLELGAGQDQLVRSIAEIAGLRFSTRPDLAGHERAAILALRK